MYFPTKRSDVTAELAVKLSSLTHLVCAAAPTADKPFVIAASNDIFSEVAPTRLLRISEGRVDYYLKNTLVMHFEEGDLLGLPRSLNLPHGRFACTSPVTLVAYDRDTLVEYANSELKSQRNWTYFLLCNLSFYEQAFTQDVRGEFQPSAGFVHYKTGEMIIQQGDVADRVYTLLDGSADAICDDIKVGDINPNEIFGALAVFTRQPRMASVIARTDCTVLAVRKEEFITLIEHQPHICRGLIEEMAAKIHQLNSQLSQLKSHPLA